MKTSKNLSREEMLEIQQVVDNFKTESTHGFTIEEIDTLIEPYKSRMNMKKFNDAMTGHTCHVENKKVRFYVTDVYTALLCGLENRGFKMWEFD